MTEHATPSSNPSPSAQPPDSSAAAPPIRPSHKQPSRAENFKSFASTLAVLLLAPLIAILLTAYIFQSYQVDGQSMQNTLFNNDRLIIWKTPVTWSHITGHAYIPNRGDIIIFTDPKLSEFGQDPGKQLIKRVIALPGERVVVANGVVAVYNAQHPNGFDPDTTLPYNRTARDTNDDVDVTVPAGDIYVMGDNRPDSLDSRALGPVPVNRIIGKLVVRVLPINQIKRF